MKYALHDAKKEKIISEIIQKVVLFVNTESDMSCQIFGILKWVLICASNLPMKL